MSRNSILMGCGYDRQVIRIRSGFSHNRTVHAIQYSLLSNITTDDEVTLHTLFDGPVTNSIRFLTVRSNLSKVRVQFARWSLEALEEPLFTLSSIGLSIASATFFATSLVDTTGCHRTAGIEIPTTSGSLVLPRLDPTSKSPTTFWLSIATTECQPTGSAVHVSRWRLHSRGRIFQCVTHVAASFARTSAVTVVPKEAGLGSNL